MLRLVDDTSVRSNTHIRILSVWERAQQSEIRICKVQSFFRMPTAYVLQEGTCDEEYVFVTEVLQRPYYSLAFVKILGTGVLTYQCISPGSHLRH